MLHLRRLFLSFATLALLLLAGCAASGAQSPQIETDSYFIFDTIVTVKLYDDPAANEHLTEIERILHRIDALMNRQEEASEIAQVNALAGIQPVRVSAETIHLLRVALAYAELSDGSFDPTIGPLVDLWGIGDDTARRPSAAELRDVVTLVDYTDVLVDEDAMTIYLPRQGMSLDLGAIAKGYAADQIAAYLQEQGVESAIIDLGGNILATGSKPDGNLWTIGIQEPDASRGSTIGTIKVKQQSIVSSGVYERFFIEEGVRYHHIFDTSSGYPIHNGLASVTVITPSSTDADALSTVIFSLGLRDGLAFVESLADTEAIFITEENQVIVSDGLRGKLNIDSSVYRLIE